MQADADAEGRIDWSRVSVDSTSCRAHQHAAEARKSPPRVPGKWMWPARHRPVEALGRSRGGLTTKIHQRVRAAEVYVGLALVAEGGMDPAGLGSYQRLDRGQLGFRRGDAEQTEASLG